MANDNRPTESRWRLDDASAELSSVGEGMSVSSTEFTVSYTHHYHHPSSLPPLPASDPALILELKTRRPPSLVGRAGCETWSVDFSPDGAWFAWSMGHGIVWVVAWPLDSE